MRVLVVVVMATAQKGSGGTESLITVSTEGVNRATASEADFTTTKYSPLKVNTDITIRKGGRIGVGMVVKNHNGRVIEQRWMRMCGPVGTTRGEAAAVKAAMEQVEAEHVKFYTDCNEIMSVIPGDISLPVDEFEYVTLESIPREKNLHADLLADKAVSGSC